MKVRKEISGLHWFDRVTGLHLLFDEILIPSTECSVVPRTVSIALTNKCDLRCSYCYCPKSEISLPLDFVLRLAKTLDDLGCLEVTLGGGEPLLYPQFPEVCKWIWDNTNLAISVTTHGHHLSSSIISQIADKISSLRFSIDGIEPYYSQVKGRPLRNLVDIILGIRGKIPFGINTVVRPGKLCAVSEVIELAIEIGSGNVLIIPEHKDGQFILEKCEWQQLNRLLDSYKSKIQLFISNDAYEFVTINCLETESKDEFLFGHVSAERKLKPDSYSKHGITIEDINQLGCYFSELTCQKGGFR